MTKNQATAHAKRKHTLQLRRNRKNKKTRLHDQLMAKHEKSGSSEPNTPTTLTEAQKDLDKVVVQE